MLLAEGGKEKEEEKKKRETFDFVISKGKKETGGEGGGKDVLA